MYFFTRVSSDSNELGRVVGVEGKVKAEVEVGMSVKGESMVTWDIGNTSVKMLILLGMGGRAVCLTIG